MIRVKIGISSMSVWLAGIQEVSGFAGDIWPLLSSDGDPGAAMDCAGPLQDEEMSGETACLADSGRTQR